MEKGVEEIHPHQGLSPRLTREQTLLILMGHKSLSPASPMALIKGNSESLVYFKVFPFIMALLKSMERIYLIPYSTFCPRDFINRRIPNHLVKQYH